MIRMLITAVILLGVVRLCSNITPTPDVHFSVMSGKCVEVLQSSKSNFNCSNLPNKYNKVWVE